MEPLCTSLLHPPTLVLIGKCPAGAITQKPSVSVMADTLGLNEAEYIRDAIFLSALTAVASKTRDVDVLESRSRAKRRGVSFPMIKDFDAILSAGTKECNRVMRIVPVTPDDYTKLLKSFVESQS